MRRAAATLVAAVALLGSGAAPAAEHAIAMHGAPALPPGYAHFPHANPEAPKGGTLTLSRVGAFDSLNPFLVRGQPAAGLHLTFDGLLQRSWDEPFTLYAHLAERVMTPEDRSWVEFHVRPGARFHDGAEVTVEDVLFSLATLRRHGRPNHRQYYADVTAAERVGERGVRLHFGNGGNRELPLLLGLMPILPAHAFGDRAFDRVSLLPIPGTGAYRVAEIDAGRRAVYARVPGHWGENLPAARGQNNFDRMVYDYFRDESVRQLAFRAGQVDMATESDPRRWALEYDFPAVRDGRVRLETLPHGRSVGMFALVWNARRPLFGDASVRRALGQAFDFDWVNANFFHDAHARTDSFFANSELAATGQPSAAEMELLSPLSDHLPPALFDRPYLPPGDARSGDLRRRLRLASDALTAAGYPVRDQVRVEAASGRPFAFEILLARREDERLALTFADNLTRLGVEVRVRTVDSAQYQERLDRFDFDTILYTWGQSLSPGNEQAFYWSAAAAGEAGSRNYAGIADAAVDALLERLVRAATRDGLIAATRALDRALLWGEHVLPLFHDQVDRIAYWDRFGRPERIPLYGYRIETWWLDPTKAAR